MSAGADGRSDEATRGEVRASRNPREPRDGDLLERARRAGVLSSLDLHVAERLAAIFGERDEAVRWAAALACRQESQGHVCADLPRLVAEGLAREEGPIEAGLSALGSQPSLASWLAALAASPLVDVEREDDAGADSGAAAATASTATAAAAGEVRPLVLDAKGRLFLRRLDRAERSLAATITARATAPDLALGAFDVAGEIERVLADRGPDPDPAPRRALALGLSRPLAILTGGPGTGKTTLVARLVRLLIVQARAAGTPVPRVLMLAPTGKAAAAMAGSFARERADAGLDEAVREALPREAETIHRALARLGRSGVRQADPARRRLEADVVVVDEASMVDLEQMAGLFEACEGVARVVLLGDPRQLASVEAGAVLADLCGDAEGAAEPADVAGSGRLGRSIVRLTRSHRYAEAGGIGLLAEAVRAGDADRALAILADPDHPEVERLELESAAVLGARLAAEVRGLQAAVAATARPEEKLARLGAYRVLCAHRRGPIGVEALARLLDEASALERRVSARSAVWPGRLLLVTQNAPEQSLWNGDVGLVEQAEDGLRVLFPDAHGGVRLLSLARLPAHESAIAMSVHKSQGSEFDTVDLVLAPHVSRLMTRELLYTGITRARRRLRIHGSEAVVRAALARRARRDSGLVDRLADRLSAARLGG